MDIFSQELLKLQNIYKDNCNYNKSLNSRENNDSINNNENQKYINEVNNNNKNNDDIAINDSHNNSKKNVNNIINNLDNKDYNNTHKIDNNNKIKLEKIHQLSLNNINNLINQQTKKKLGSHETNFFQDTSKIINNETKDATDKDNEYLNDKWPSPLHIEKEVQNVKNNNEISKEVSEESIDFTNISLAENLNINQEVYNKTINITKKNSNISKLDIQNKLNKINIDPNDKLNNISKKANIINQGITNDNFNEEFLKNYDKFSDSWRKEVDKMLKKGKEKK